MCSVKHVDVNKKFARNLVLQGILVLGATEDENLSFESVRSVEENDKVHLRTELLNYMKNLLLQNSSGAVASVDMMHEFTPL